MKSLNDYLEDIDVSDSMYELATKRYESLAEFIQKSELKQYEPDIFLQGSIKLGTMIKPLTDDGSYDIDIVCKLNHLSCHDISQSDLKECVGKVLQAYNNEKPFKNPIKNGKRCWTLTYVDKFNFHIDILPAISYNSNYSDFICITDKSNPNYKIITSDWEISNPKGYYNWFKEQEQFNTFKEFAILESRSTTERIPYYKVKTELRKIIQLLKRHAEVMFKDLSEYKPSSIIITTLAAKGYSNIKSNISFKEKLDILIRDFTNYLDKDIDNQICILNPANPDENLSLKWKTNKKYFDYFNEWIEKLKLDFSVNESRILINENSISDKLRESLQVGRYYEIEQIDHLAHHQKPKWKYASKIFNILIKAYIQQDLDKKVGFKSGSPIYNKHTLLFEVEDEWNKDYELYWQVTNTGGEATMANCLRGDFIGPVYSKCGRYTHCEETKYRGEHYIEAYVVKNNICYGRSKPFIVNLKF